MNAEGDAKTGSGSSTVAGLRPDTAGHDLLVKVLEAKVVQDRPARPGGKPQRIAECTVGDDTGVIYFTARNEQVELLKKGSYVHLRNAKIDMLRGNMRLAVNQFGKIEPASGVSFETKDDFNLSLVEFELVPVPAAAATAPAEASPPAEGQPAEEAAAEPAEPAAEAAAEPAEPAVEAAA